MTTSLIREISGIRLHLRLTYFHNDQWLPLRLASDIEFISQWAANGIDAQLTLTPKSNDEWNYGVLFRASHATAVRLAVSCETAERCFHLIPANIHGDNNAHRIGTAEFPLLAESTDPTEVFRAPVWAFSADRAPVPASMLCLPEAAIGISIQPYAVALRDDAPGEPDIVNGLFAELPTTCGVSLGHKNEPVTFVNKGQWAEATLHAERELKSRGRLFVLHGPGRARAHEITHRLYEEFHERPTYHRTHREAAQALLDTFLEVNWSAEFDHYTNQRCGLPNDPVLKPWRPLVEIGWSGGAVLAYPFFLAQHALGLPDDYFGARKNPHQICDEIVAGFNERSGFFSDLSAEWPAGSGNRLNGWWAGYTVQDCHCAYTNASAVFYLLKSIKFLQSIGQAVPRHWLEQTLRVLDTALQLQREDGVFGITFSAEERRVLSYDGFAGCWFAAALPLAHRLTSQTRYLEAAERALDFYGQSVRALACSGTPMDTRHSVDHEGNLAYVRAARLLHEITGDPRHLDHLLAGAHYEYLWRYAYRAHPHAPPLKNSGWNSCGASITSVSNPHAHPMGVMITGDLQYLAHQTGDSYHADRATDALAWAMQTLDLYPTTTGYGRYGVLSERFCPSDGLLIEHYEDGTPASTWLSYNGWAAANVLEAIAEELLSEAAS